MSQLKNLMDMFSGDPFRKLRFLEKPFLDSTAEFYAAEAKQVLEQSSDISLYLKHINVRTISSLSNLHIIGCLCECIFP